MKGERRKGKAKRRGMHRKLKVKRKKKRINGKWKERE